MSKVLEALHRLQKVELELAAFRQSRGAKERRVEHLQRQVRLSEGKLEANLASGRRRQMRLDSVQLDVDTREESLGRHRTALNGAKTNKEYAAILTAMNTEKADTSKYETEILQLMEEVQTFANDAELVDAERSKLTSDVERAEEALRAYDDKSKSKRDKLEAQREELATDIDPTTLQVFTRVAARHDGEAIVSVERINPKRDEYICGGCNLTITLEIVNALHTREEIQICRSCSRILCLPK